MFPGNDNPTDDNVLQVRGDVEGAVFEKGVAEDKNDRLPEGLEQLEEDVEDRIVQLAGGTVEQLAEGSIDVEELPGGRRNPKRNCRKNPIKIPGKIPEDSKKQDNEDSDDSQDSGDNGKKQDSDDSDNSQDSGDSESCKSDKRVDISEEEGENEEATGEARRKAQLKKALKAALVELRSNVDTDLDLLKLKEPMHILQRELILKAHLFRTHDAEQYRESDEDSRDRLFAALKEEEESYLKESTSSEILKHNYTFIHLHINTFTFAVLKHF